jgi:NADH-quinone oxidoreductase subunit L
MTFHGQFRGGVAQELEDNALAAQSGGTTQPVPAGASHEGGVHLAESPVVMVFPMLVLGAAAIAAGYLANPQWVQEIGIPRHWISEFLGSGLGEVVPSLAEGLEPHGFSRWLATVSTVLAVVGLAAAAVIYLRRGETDKRDPLEEAGPVHTLLSNKYYVDALYEDTLVRRVLYGNVAGVLDWLDRNVVDGTVDTLGWISRNIGPAVGRLQTGQVQAYGAAIALGILLIVLGFLLS